MKTKIIQNKLVFAFLKGVSVSGIITMAFENVKGEGLVGLTRGFMYAGARRVVVSLCIE